MKFKVDENLPREVAELLREKRFEASTVSEEGLGGKADEAIMEACRREGRVLVTLDLDFGDVRSYPPEDCPGCMVLRLRRHDKKHILGAMRQAIALMENEPLPHHLWIVEEARIRIRGPSNK